MAASTEVAGGRAFPRLHWGAVIAGVLLALAANVVLGLVGAALGFATGPSGSRAVGAAAAIWGLVTPFVATLLGAWLACRMAEAADTSSRYLHGILVWCIGLIAGALFLTATIATGAMSAGTAASGNLGAAQRTLRGEPGARGRTATTATPQQAAKTAAEGAGGGALAAIAGLLGGIVGGAIAGARRRGAGPGRWGTAFRRDETRAGAMHAGDRGFGTTYGETPATPGTTAGLPPEGPPGDPYHH